jgi:phosphatidylinositol alpha-1,6-mannosyltransferase
MSRELDVLVLTPDFPPALGGIQLLMHRVLSHAPALRARVVTLGSRSDRDFDRGEGLEVTRVGLRRIPRPGAVAVLNARGVVEGLRKRPDVVLSGHIATSPAASAIGRVLGVPVVQYLYGHEVGVRPRLAAYAVRHADRVVAISGYTRELALAAGADPDRVALVTPGVDLPERNGASPASGRNGGGPKTVITVGRLEDRYKGHDVMIRALPLVRAHAGDVRWVVVGEGSLRGPLESLARATGVEDLVHFAGAVPDDERDALLADADVFAMPSRLPADGLAGEGFGIVYLEAGARGLPVVAGAVGGALDAVVDGGTGLLVDPNDHVAVAHAIGGLLADPARADALGRAGAEHARRHAWPAVAERLERLLRQVAAEGA